MRICYVCADPGIPVFGSKGASIHVQAVLTELLNRGHEVSLLTPRPDGESTAVAVHQLPPVRGSETAERERSAQHSDAAIAAQLDRLDPHLVYERYSLWGATATSWAVERGVASILEVNAPLVEEQAAYRQLVDRAGAERVARQAISVAGAVVCVSDPVADWARSRAAHPGRVHTLPNGVDTDRIVPAARPVAPADAPEFTVGFVGTLKAWHGLEVLVAAMAELIRTDPSWRLLIVGDGPLRAVVERLAADLGIDHRVSLTGAVPAGGVVAHLHRMDLATAPYPQQECYFSPLKVYEYLAAGLPVVASAVGQLPDALEHGRLGVLVPAGDAAALAAALQALRLDQATRSRLREQSRQTALERYTWRSVVDRALALTEPVGIR
ncbi:MAG TPA: glycosyltransferase family 4 protein [Propionibacteriaceae bacterium]|nr:glycosyltransferase family 4 protein [Propionibacteriaceae bacterium]